MTMMTMTMKPRWLAAVVVAMTCYCCCVVMALEPFAMEPPQYTVVARKLDPELNYHRILGTTIWATTEEIRNNFRSLSRIYYGTEEFHTMTEAYTVLTNPRLRALYEKGGLVALWGHDDPKFEDHLRDTFEMKSEFKTGSFSMRFGMKDGEEKKSPTVTHDLKLPLENFISGITISIAIVRKEICPVCNGTGGAVAAELLTCPVCAGKKTHSSHAHFHGGWKQTWTRACKTCDGTGEVASVPCPHCGGTRVVEGKKEISIVIEPGTPEGHPYEFIGEAEQVPGAAPGNVVITVSSKPHPLFQREGADLVCERNITLMQALMGFEMPIQLIDGSTIVIRRDELSKPGTVHEVPDEGMPVYQSGKERGKLKVRLNIVFPERIAITDEKKQALRSADSVKKRKRKTKVIRDDGTEEEIEEEYDAEDDEHASTTNTTATADSGEAAGTTAGGGGGGGEEPVVKKEEGGEDASSTTKKDEL